MSDSSDSSSDRGDELQNIHNDAEVDGSNNDYDKPHSLFSILTDSSANAKDKIEENEAYDAGWENGNKQR